MSQWVAEVPLVEIGNPGGICFLQVVMGLPTGDIRGVGDYSSQTRDRLALTVGNCHLFGPKQTWFSSVPPLCVCIF